MSANKTVRLHLLSNNESCNFISDQPRHNINNGIRLQGSYKKIPPKSPALSFRNETNTLIKPTSSPRYSAKNHLGLATQIQHAINSCQQIPVLNQNHIEELNCKIKINEAENQRLKAEIHSLTRSNKLNKEMYEIEKINHERLRRFYEKREIEWREIIECQRKIINENGLQPYETKITQPIQQNQMLELESVKFALPLETKIQRPPSVRSSSGRKVCKIYNVKRNHDFLNIAYKKAMIEIYKAQTKNGLSLEKIIMLPEFTKIKFTRHLKERLTQFFMKLAPRTDFLALSDYLQQTFSSNFFASVIYDQLVEGIKLAAESQKGRPKSIYTLTNNQQRTANRRKASESSQEGSENIFELKLNSRVPGSVFVESFLKQQDHESVLDGVVYEQSEMMNFSDILQSKMVTKPK